MATATKRAGRKKLRVKTLAEIQAWPADLRRAKAATKMGAESPATKNGMAKKRRKLTSTERKTIEGRFAVHLRALMDAKGWQVGDLHEQLTRFAVDIEKPAIHVWLRGKSLPKAKFLEPLGRALGLKDYREVLPPPVE